MAIIIPGCDLSINFAETLVKVKPYKLKKLNIYQVDAFAERIFTGNPAAVVVLDEWPEKDQMQNIASENNLSETAFIVRDGEHFEIRWFTPAVEVDLCGHATLAAAYVVFTYLNRDKNNIVFKSFYRGDLGVERTGDLYVLDFPADVFTEVSLPQQIKNGIGITPVECYKGLNDYLLIYNSEHDIEAISPDFNLLKTADGRGVIITSPAEKWDFVSRFFAPSCGINEDPVTGSAHTTLIPYWSERLKKEKLTACQLSGRTGVLYCEYHGQRVKIGGKASLYLEGKILLT